MPHFEKWLHGVSPDDPVSEVARHALRNRLKAVRYYLKQSEGATSDDPEPVHQLRVWCRRSAAALRMFGDVIPRKQARKLRDTVRKLRRLGGEARDRDLLIATLADQPTDSVTVRVARRLRKERKKAQRPIDRAKRKLVDRGKLKRLTRKATDRLKWRTDKRGEVEPRFADWTKHTLEALLDDFLSFDAAMLRDDEQLHRLRIAGKRLRYAAELSAEVFPKIASGGAYDQLSGIQARLGNAVDHLAAAERLSSLLDNASSAELTVLEQTIVQHRRQFAVKKRKFLHWWSQPRRRSFENRWRNALRVPPNQRSGNQRANKP